MQNYIEMHTINNIINDTNDPIPFGVIPPTLPKLNKSKNS